MINYKKTIQAVEENMALFSGLKTEEEKIEWMREQMTVGSILMNMEINRGSFDEKAEISREGHRVLDRSCDLISSLPRHIRAAARAASGRC